MRKISELKNDEALDVLAAITPHIENILSDDDLMSQLSGTLDFENCNTMAEKYAIALKKLTPISTIIFKKRRYDFYGILSALEGVSVEDVKNRNFLKTLLSVRQIAKDKDLIDFFKSCMGAGGEE